MSEKPRSGSGNKEQGAAAEEQEVLDPQAIQQRLQDILTKDLLRAAKAGDAQGVRECAITLEDVNHQDDHGMTALHWAVAKGARPCIRALVSSGKCNYLVRDEQGRYASELAYELSEDFGVGRLLAKKEAEQAAKEGVEHWPKT